MAARRVIVPAKEVEAESVSHTSAYVPDKKIADGYVGRTVNNIPDQEIFEKALELNLNVLLRGDTGSGKTLAGAAFAARVGALYYSVPCDVSIEPSAFFGKRHPGENQGEFPWIDGPVTQVVRGKCGLGDKCRDETCIAVLNISEINFMSPKISASLFPLLDSRRSLPLLAKDGEVVRAHTRLLIIGDMNPGYRGTQPLNAAFANRFPITIDWGYDEKVERKLVKSKTLYDIAKKIRAMPDEVQTPTGTNRLLEFDTIAVEFNIDFAIQIFLNGYSPEERTAIEKLMELERTRLNNDYNPPKDSEVGVNEDEEDDDYEDDEDEDLPYFETVNEEYEFEAEYKYSPSFNASLQAANLPTPVMKNTPPSTDKRRRPTSYKEEMKMREREMRRSRHPHPWDGS